MMRNDHSPLMRAPEGASGPISEQVFRKRGMVYLGRRNLIRIGVVAVMQGDLRLVDDDPCRACVPCISRKEYAVCWYTYMKLNIMLQW